MQTIQIIISGLVALGVLVFVHEFGHFAVAKLAGIRVLKFSLGFGTKIFGFKRGDTEYLISWLPLGGYVKLAGEQLDETHPVEPGDYYSRPWWVRLFVLFAGPLMNLVAAALVLGTLYWVGFSVPLAKPQIMGVNPNTPAAQAGLSAGDVIVSMNNQAVDDWERFAERLNQLVLTAPGKPVTLSIQRRKEIRSFELLPVQDAKSKRWLLGITLAPAGTNVVDRVMVGTPAEMAGLKDGDRMVAVEDQEVLTKYDFQTAIWPRGNQPTRIRVQRGTEILERTITPMVQSFPGQGKVGVIGVQFKASDAQHKISYPFFTAYSYGVLQTWNITSTIFISLGQMISGQISAKDSVGGPISIVRMAGQEARSGPVDFLFFLAGISVMLGVLNLLPIPILDGGNAVFFILEGILGHPVSMKWQEISQRVGFALLMGLMVFATYTDISKLVTPFFGAHP
jgi:regulator of sigma E protease